MVLHVSVVPGHSGTLMAWTKWLPFCKNFQMHFFLEIFFLCINKCSLKFVPTGQNDNTALVICLAVTCFIYLTIHLLFFFSSRLVIVWSNYDPVHWCMHTQSDLGELTHLPLDKMNTMFKCIFLNENIWISNKISLKYVPWVLIDNMSALVQIMAWGRPGDKLLSETILTHFTDACIQH